MYDKENTFSNIVILLFLAFMAGLIAWSHEREQESMRFKRHQIEEATGCKVMESAYSGCEPITIPFGRYSQLYFKCCPPKE